MKPHVMLDLETMGVASNSVVISIGAVQFIPETGELGARFYTALDFEDACRYGVLSPSTIKWWMSQSNEARGFAMAGTDEVEPVLTDLAEWFGALPNALVWGNGADFDNVILMNFYESAGMVQPWGKYNNRCYRTLKSISAKTDPGFDIGADPKPIREGTHHNALDDAIFQARMAMWMCRMYGLSLS